MAIELKALKDWLSDLADVLEASEERADQRLGESARRWADMVPEEIVEVMTQNKTCKTVQWSYLTPVSAELIRAAVAKNSVAHLQDWNILSENLPEQVVRFGVHKWIPSTDDPVWNSQFLVQAHFQTDLQELPEIPLKDPADHI